MNLKPCFEFIEKVYCSCKERILPDAQMENPKIIPTHNEEKSKSEILHFGGCDIVLNMNTRLGDDVRYLAMKFENGVPPDWKADPEARDHPHILYDDPKTPRYVLKTRNLIDPEMLELAKSDPTDKPNFRKYQGLRSRRGVYAANSIINEVKLAPVIADIIASDKVQALAKEAGFTKFDFAPPLLAIVDRKTGDKSMLYEYSGFPLKVGLSFWQYLNPKNWRDLKFRIKFQDRGIFTARLADIFKENQITPVDLVWKQILVAPDLEQGAYKMVLIDTEGFYKNPDARPGFV